MIFQEHRWTCVIALPPLMTTSILHTPSLPADLLNQHVFAQARVCVYGGVCVSVSSDRYLLGDLRN